MNILLSYYLDKNSIHEWKEKFSSAAQKLIMYKFKGTNGRYLTSFDTKFKEFLSVEGLSRNEWPTYDNGQLIHKQYTVPMIESKLFYKEEGIYYKTAKGKLYEDYLTLELNKDEKWLLNYLLLVDSTILNKENYIINRSLEINDILVNSTSDYFVAKACSEFFIDKNNIINQKDLAWYDYLYLNVFYLEPEFLRLYVSASENERNELKEFVYKNFEHRNSSCCISKKFLSTNYSVPEIIDDLKIFMFSLQINKIKYSDFESTMKSIVEMYSANYDINKSTILNFIFDNKYIFEPILMNLFKVEDVEDIEENKEEDYCIDQLNIPVNIADMSDRPEARIDDTTIEGKQQLRNIFAMRKKIAREKSGFTCELETYKGCRYFTSKTTNHNYVEVHHFVPREFRNNFEYSVDVLANYITLCPHCHRMIHLANDRERIDAIRYIYNQRKNRLISCGIEVELEELFDFYNIEEK